MKIRPLRVNELDKARVLISSVFDQFVAPQYSKEGIKEFYNFIEIDNLQEQLDANSFMLVAEKNAELIGVIGIRNCEHVFVLFVRGDQQNKGIGRSLFFKAMARCKMKNPSIKRITVNASPNAVEAYKRLGFVPIETERLVNGIRFVSMVFEVNQK